METYTFLDAQQISEKDRQEILALLEDQFDTQNDPDQMPINDESRIWIQTKLPDCATLIKHDHTVVGSTFVMPCTQIAMQEFVEEKITEAELAGRMQKEDISYSRMQAIYLCSAFIIALP